MQYVLSSMPINTQCRYASSHTTSWLYTTKPSNVCASRTRLDDQTQILSQAVPPLRGRGSFLCLLGTNHEQPRSRVAANPPLRVGRCSQEKAQPYLLQPCSHLYCSQVTLPFVLPFVLPYPTEPPLVTPTPVVRAIYSSTSTVFFLYICY